MLGSGTASLHDGSAMGDIRVKVVTNNTNTTTTSWSSTAISESDAVDFLTQFLATQKQQAQQQQAQFLHASDPQRSYHSTMSAQPLGLNPSMWEDLYQVARSMTTVTGEDATEDVARRRNQRERLHQLQHETDPIHVDDEDEEDKHAENQDDFAQPPSPEEDLTSTGVHEDPTRVVPEELPATDPNEPRTTTTTTASVVPLDSRTEPNDAMEPRAAATRKDQKREKKEAKRAAKKAKKEAKKARKEAKKAAKELKKKNKKDKKQARTSSNVKTEEE